MERKSSCGLDDSDQAVVEWLRRENGRPGLLCEKGLPLTTRLHATHFVLPFSFLIAIGAWGQTAAPAPAQSLPGSKMPPQQLNMTPGEIVHFVPPAHVDTPLGEVARMPGDGAGAYKTQHYRDLFAEQGHSRPESQAKIEKAFQQLFHGDGQEERIYFENGTNENGPLAYVTDWANNDARTEGMSYGMMIAVQLNKKNEFDALWNWSKTYMLITDPANPSVGYFAWSMNTDGTPRSTGAAPDGEEYYAMALYFAAHRWGNGKGIYNYQAEADKILRGMRHHPVLKGTGPFRIHPGDEPFVTPDHPWPSPNNRAMEQEGAASGKPLPTFRFPHGPRAEEIGPMVKDDFFMIKFVPDMEGAGASTDASYHLPAFYELWSRWGPIEDREFWAKAADVSRNFFNEVTDTETGLAPDRSHFDGSQAMGWDGKPTPFSYDSWRTVSNWSVDYAWWHKDAREIARSDKIQKFLLNEGIDKFADRYTLDGKTLSTRHSVGMLSTTAVGALAATDGPAARTFVQKLWDTPTPSGEQRYYDGLLYLMSLMHCSGNFRVIGAH